jgi:hypothetical protein
MIGFQLIKWENEMKVTWEENDIVNGFKVSAYGGNKYMIGCDDITTPPQSRYFIFCPETGMIDSRFMNEIELVDYLNEHNFIPV